MEIRTEFVYTANGGRDVSERTRGIRDKLGKPLLPPLELAAQDQRARLAFLGQFPQLGLSYRLPLKDGAQPRLQGGVKRL
jgi:hypothetical protein